jgi:hypothetical protein
VRKLLPLVGLLAAMSLPAAAPAAEIGLNVSGGAAASEGDVNQVADAGAKWARHFLYFDDIDAAGMRAFRQNVLVPEHRRGVKTLIVVAGKTQSAPNSDEYAARMREMAQIFKGGGQMAYEVWNEADEPLWWKPSPNPAAYVDLLKKSYGAIKAEDPGAIVLATPTTGANYLWVEELYKNGAKGSFDAMSVHTDTACLIDSPYSYYRDPAAGNRIARFTFLGVREVKAVMVANGDADKPVWITELGWAARAGETCDSGAFAGKKAAGVNEQQQAQFMLEAFHCLQVDPAFGVTVAMWFTHRDPHYGLYRADGSPRPALDAFKSMAGDTANDKLSGPCGDFVAPGVQILEPQPGAVIGLNDSLKIRATSDDKSILRMTFAVASTPQEIRNFTNNGNPLDLAGNMPFLDWQGVKKLPVGDHRVIVTAIDPSGNEGRAEVPFKRINPSSLPPKAVKFAACPTKKKKGVLCKNGLSLSGKGRNRKLAGKLSLPYAFGLTAKDKVKVEWQNKRKGKWKKIHAGTKAANKPSGFVFSQRLKFGGAWRVRVTFDGKPPYKKTVGKWITFKA